MVHKIVVYRLPFFEGACRNDFEVRHEGARRGSKSGLGDGCANQFQEAEEDVIYFPDDPANAMRLLVMSLYGFTLAESIQEVYGAANASYNNVPILAETFDLSHKYLVPGLDRTILEYLQICYNDSSADIAFAKDGWFWRLAEYLYEDHDRAPGIRICLPIMLGKHVCLRGDLDDVSQQELRKFPELTIQLAQLTIRAVTYARGNNKLVDERTTASSQGGPGGGVPSRQGGP